MRKSIILRIRRLMKYYELNISETAQKIGISQPNLSAMLSGKRPIGGNIINKFIISFGINKDWLESGQGEMYNLDTRRLESGMKQTELILTVTRALPHSNQISELTLCDDGGVMFTWRDHTFIVSKNLFVEELKGSIRCGSDLALLVEALIKR